MEARLKVLGRLFYGKREEVVMKSARTLGRDALLEDAKVTGRPCVLILSNGRDDSELVWSPEGALSDPEIQSNILLLASKLPDHARQRIEKSLAEDREKEKG